MSQGKKRKARSLVPSEQDAAAVLRACLSPACFWAPDQLGPQSAWLEHAPFAFWLVEALRPRVFVELGTHGGFSYFAFCQAVQRLQLDTRCFAVDTWKGDEQAGLYGEEVYAQIRARHDRFYLAFSTLIRGSFDQALSYFGDGTIDLLHIDGRHFYEDVKHDFDAWRPKLSSRGMVLFHDTNMRERDFGVFKFWEELRAAHPHFEFVHGHGLGVLGVGRKLPDAVAKLFVLAERETAVSHIRSVYARLGSTISLEHTAQHQAADIAAASAQVAELNRALQMHTAEILRLGNELIASRRQNEEIAATLAAHSTELVGLGDQLTVARRQTEERAAALAVRSAEVVESREQLETELANTRAQAERIRELTGTVGERSRELSLLRASTSWRVTRPLRSAKRLLGRVCYSGIGYQLTVVGRAFLTRSRLPLQEWRAYKTISRSGLFDRQWYLKNNPDVAASGIDPILHYVNFGVREGRDPSPIFSNTDYLDRDSNAAAVGVNPLSDFIPKGIDPRGIEKGCDERSSKELTAVFGSKGRVSRLAGRLNDYGDAAAADDWGSSTLIWGLEMPPPSELYVGRGLALPINGYCYSKTDVIDALEINAGNRKFQVHSRSLARPDVLRSQCPVPDQLGKSLMSGFRGFLPIYPVSSPEDVTVVLRATLRSGKVIDQPVGEMRLLPGTGVVPTQVEWPAAAAGPRVVICMTTFNPPFDLFDAQVKSIQAQHHANWVCIVSDDQSQVEVFERIRERLKGDKRFYVFRNDKRRGFYYNFESCLKKIPPDAEFVALCDQDDRWNPNKLDTLLAAFHPETELVYSDARIVTSNGQVRSSTFWTGRANNFTDLASLLVANTITGAASIFRASLVAELLPFPTPIGHAFHDHWIGIVALTKGNIGYIDESLYDYVQHSVNIIGHKYSDVPGLIWVVRQLAGSLRDRERLHWVIREILNRAVESFELVAQKALLARNLLIRFPDAPLSKRTVLKRFARLDTSLFATVREKLLAVIHRRPTLNYEGLFLYSIVFMRLRNARYRCLRKRLVDRQQKVVGRARPIAFLPLPNVPTAVVNKSLPAPAQVGVANSVASALRVSKIYWITHNISPLTLDISPRYPRRINLLLATIDFRYVYGGYIGMFSVALDLKRAGHTVRIILHEQTDFNLDQWRRLIQKYAGLSTLFDEIEVIYRFDRSLPVEVNPDDNFIATNCWTAHVAHHAVRAIGKERFMFMIQEYEPFFVPMNSINALFRQAYELPHFGLFSTSFLLEFFRDRRIGVFAEQGGEVYSAVFKNAIHRFSPSRDQLIRDKKRLLFYARPEDHAARNLFELGMMSLVALLHDARFDSSNWTFHGIGSISVNQILELAPGVPIEIMHRTSLQEYVDLLPSFDVGLSLMLTPHPSLVPLEMAAAGMWAVTNTFANKTADRLRAISTNLIGVKPTVRAIHNGLFEAISKVDDIDARLAGAEVRWPTDWNGAFHPETIQKMEAFFASSKDETLVSRYSGSHN